MKIAGTFTNRPPLHGDSRGNKDWLYSELTGVDLIKLTAFARRQIGHGASDWLLTIKSIFVNTVMPRR